MKLYLDEKSFIWYCLAFPRLTKDKEQGEEHFYPLYARDNVLHLGRHARGNVFGEGVEAVESSALRAIVVNGFAVAQFAIVVQVNL